MNEGDKLEKIAEKYLISIEKCIEPSIQKCKHQISLCYTLSMFRLAIDAVDQFIKDNLKKNIEKIEKMRSMLESIYGNMKVKDIVKIPSMPKGDMLCLAKYSTKTFSIPEKILTLLEGTVTEKDNSLVSLYEMFILTSFYDVPYKISRQCFIKNKGLLEIDPLVIMNHNANIATLKMISKKLYPNDILHLNAMPSPPEKTVMTMNNILDVL